MWYVIFLELQYLTTSSMVVYQPKNNMFSVNKDPYDQRKHSGEFLKGMVDLQKCYSYQD